MSANESVTARWFCCRRRIWGTARKCIGGGTAVRHRQFVELHVAILGDPGASRRASLKHEALRLGLAGLARVIPAIRAGPH